MIVLEGVLLPEDALEQLLEVPILGEVANGCLDGVVVAVNPTLSPEDPDLLVGDRICVLPLVLQEVVGRKDLGAVPELPTNLMWFDRYFPKGTTIKSIFAMGLDFRTPSWPRVAEVVSDSMVAPM